MSERTKSHGWSELDVQLSMPAGVQSWRVFSKDGCGVIVSREDHGGKLRWHLSISRQDRYPHWEEIKDSRYSLLPLGLYFAMILPPPQEYVNLHQNCFHLWEIDDGEW